MKALKKLIPLLLAVALLTPGGAYAAPPALKLSAAGAAIVDVATGRLLYAQNEHARLPMASTTKVMTALLTLEHEKQDTVLTVPKEAYGMEGSSMYLKLGEKITVRDLLFGLMLSSGNDAAVTLAMRVGGSVEGFAQLMNTRAAELGCTDTNFVTPNGLHDENHYTSAYDLARISAEAMKNPSFREIVSTKYYRTVTGDAPRSLRNKNKILWQYEGGNGVKTGFTKKSGRCLVFSAERDGHILVGVILNAPDMWNDAKKLLDYGFQNYTWKTLAKAGEVMATAEVEAGLKNSLEMLAKDDILVPVRADEPADAVELRVNAPKVVDAPVYAGQVLGSLEAWVGGKKLAETPLVAAQTVLRKDFPYYLNRLWRAWVA